MWWKHNWFLFCFISADGYAFSQDENGIVSQSEVIRAYDTTKQRPEEWWRNTARDLGLTSYFCETDY